MTLIFFCKRPGKNSSAGFFKMPRRKIRQVRGKNFHPTDFHIDARILPSAQLNEPTAEDKKAGRHRDVNKYVVMNSRQRTN